MASGMGRVLMMKPIRIVLTPTRSRPLNILLGVGLMLVSVLLLLALATYHSTDPSLNTASPELVRNWLGLAGASVSDLLLQMLGLTAFLLPLWIGGLGWDWMQSRASGLVWLRWLGVASALIFVPALLGLLPLRLLWLHVLPIEGVAGHAASGFLIRTIGLIGAWIVSLMLALGGVYCGSARNFWMLRDWAARWSARAERRRALLDSDESFESDEESDSTASAQLGPRRGRLAELFNWPRNNDHDDPDDPNDPDDHDLAHAFQAERAAAAGDHVAAPAQTSPAPVNAASRSIWERTVTDFSDPSAQQQVPIQSVAHATASSDTAANNIAIAPMPVPTRRDADAAQMQMRVPLSPEQPEQRAPLATENRPQESRLQGMHSEATASQLALPVAGPVRASVPAHAPVPARDSVPPPHSSGFKLPPTSLLIVGTGPPAIREEQLREEARKLVEKCAEFGVLGQVVQINPGPMVTTYEFKPEAGVKYSRVTGLADDLCLAMRAESILIERMAGKSTVGIQVPNQERETIHLRDVLESELFTKAKSRLTLAMGKDINGRIVTTDLAVMPHVLIAGSTGSGKSVAINAMIMSLLYRTTPSQVRLILVDPKRVELGMYEGVPHLFTPIITEPKLAANALRNAVREMERRLKLLASRSVRNIDQYNKLFEEGTPSLFAQEEDEKPLPYIVIIIDELADLMMLDRANVEESITRLAQMARAVGIHLILATQRPSVDVITGLIKANVPTRISFRLATKVDSRTILDNNGAEALLGRGDMLFMPPGTSRLVRLHAPYVSEKETAAVVEFWKAQGQAEYVEGFLEAPKEERAALDGSGGEDDGDPLFDDAVRLVFEFGKASTSLLQRRLRVGYGRAAHLIDLMEQDGLIGPADGSRPRELLKPPGWLHEVSSTTE